MHPRGTPTWPDWRRAKPGTRVEHVRTGRTGTFERPSSCRNNGAIVTWDTYTAPSGVTYSASRANVVAPAFDLRPV